jgi:hypothetical protein
LSVTYRRTVVYLKVSSTNKTDWYNWTLWLKFVSNLQKNSGLSQSFFNQ